MLPSEPDGSKSDTRVELVARVPEPTALAFRPGTDDGLVASRTGQLFRIADGRVTPAPVLDLRPDTADEGDGGLLGLAYDPDEPWLYVYRTTREQDEELLAYPVGADGLPDPARRRLILAVDHGPSEQHHGGGLDFDTNGLLYLGLGDGGGLGDPRGTGQDPTTLLGKILRIDPTPWAEQPYSVPAGNPFSEREGWRPEIWALGVRNPFRLTVDDDTGDLWIGDVGQSCWEEINRLPAGAGGRNLGWDVREGNQPFQDGDLANGDSHEPELQYAHRSGWCAIVVGFVADDGAVLHTDYCRGRLVELHPATANAAPALTELGVRIERPVAIVRGPDGAPWVLSLDGAVYRLG